MTTTFADKFRKYTIADIKKDKDWNQSFTGSGHCSIGKVNGNNAFLNFFISGLDVKYQLLSEVDDFIFIPINEFVYKGETIKEIVSKL